MTTPTPFIGTPVATTKKGDIILVNKQALYVVWEKDDEKDQEPDMVGTILEDAGFNCNYFDYDDSQNEKDVAKNYGSDYAIEVIPNTPDDSNLTAARQAIKQITQENYHHFPDQWDNGQIEPGDFADQLWDDRNDQEIIRDILGLVKLTDYSTWIGVDIEKEQVLNRKSQ